MNDKPLQYRLRVPPNLTRRNPIVNPAAIKLTAAHQLPPAPKPSRPPFNLNELRIQRQIPKIEPAKSPNTPKALVQQIIPPKPHITYRTNPATIEQIDQIRRLRGKGNGRILVMIGNGPSITEVELELLKDHPNIDIMSINKPDPRIWPTTYWAFCDLSQYNRHKEIWDKYDGIIINSTAIHQSKTNSIHIKSIQGKGFSRDLVNGYNIGRSTVYANMQTALWMGYDHIYLFGVDMNPNGLNGKLWFYGNNPDAPAVMRKDRFKMEAEYYSHAASILTPDERAKYTFCSSYNPWDFVDKFGSHWDHHTAVDRILQLYG